MQISLKKISTQVILLTVFPIIFLTILIVITIQSNLTLTNNSFAERDRLETNKQLLQD